MEGTLQLLDSNVSFCLDCLFSNLGEIKLICFVVGLRCLTWAQIDAKTDWLAFPSEKGKSLYHVGRCNLLDAGLSVSDVKSVLLLQPKEIPSAGQHVVQNSHYRAKHFRGNLLVYFKVIRK